ncbi:hypothetical protein BJ742DRAFT_26677 [Cladochytrium replicatum]|nr:hypothetical protein BJ742DRAFT_26677 [Cladochytrium replicatum]
MDFPGPSSRAPKQSPKPPFSSKKKRPLIPISLFSLSPYAGSVLALTVPTACSLFTLAYTYHDWAGLERPLEDLGGFWARNHFIYHTVMRSSWLVGFVRVDSQPIALLQHLHHHVDFDHFKSSMLALWGSGLMLPVGKIIDDTAVAVLSDEEPDFPDLEMQALADLDAPSRALYIRATKPLPKPPAPTPALLGFWPTLLTFYLGGVSGALGDMYERVIVQTDPLTILSNTMSHLVTSASKTATAVANVATSAIQPQKSEDVVSGVLGYLAKLRERVPGISSGNAAGAVIGDTIWSLTGSDAGVVAILGAVTCSALYNQYEQHSERPGGLHTRAVDEGETRWLRRVISNVQIWATFLAATTALWDPLRLKGRSGASAVAQAVAGAAALGGVRRRVYGIESNVGTFGKAFAFVTGFAISYAYMSKASSQRRKGKHRAM